MSPKWMEKKGKRILGASLRAVLPSQSLSPTESDWNAVSRILLVRQDRRIGDLVMNTPLFHAVRRRFPKAHIALLLRSGYQELYADDPGIDELIPFSTGRDLYNPAGLARLVSRLRGGGYDLAVDCSNFRSFSLTNGLLTLLSGAKLRLGFEDKESPAFLNVIVKQGASRHYVENQLELLGPLGGGSAGERPWLHVGAERRERARRLLAGLGLDERAPKAIVFMDAGNKDKTWSRSCFLEVAVELKAAGVSVALGKGPGRASGVGGGADAGEARERPADLPLLPDMTIGDFAAAISCCDAFVSGDTGPMHIAAACDVSTLGVFLEDNDSRYGYTDGPRFQALRVASAGGAGRVARAALEAVRATCGDLAPGAG
jgi:ADP-heptose:LPS heptosyltransferase